MSFHHPSRASRDAEAFRRLASIDYNRPRIPAEYRFALVRDLTVRCKPLVFADIEGLARSIHRMRKGEAIQMQDRRQRMGDEEEARLGVLIYARDPDRWSYRCLGWAWLGGEGMETLGAALSALVPDDGASAFLRVEGGA